ncbi:MAG: FAD:protein FMN transferase [Candidatus Limnocylindrales bacterium]
MILAPGVEHRVSKRALPRTPSPGLCPIEPVSFAATSMGGRLVVHLEAEGRVEEARRDNRRVIARIDRWAARLTRHTDSSDLSRLNSDAEFAVPVRPTLAAAFQASVAAAEASEGFADITLLDARLAAEGMVETAAASRRGEWEVVRGERGEAVVRRPPGLRFDFGGVGKGWIADRALDLLAAWPSALIDADGDLAIRCAPGKFWEVGIDDPRTADSVLAVLRLGAPHGGTYTRWGVATSATSVHRWTVSGIATHHLIDPRTGRPAQTDVVQATVVAGSALRAEALAKAAVIAGSVEGFALLERARVRGAVLVTSSGEVRALPMTLMLLGS